MVDILAKKMTRLANDEEMLLETFLEMDGAHEILSKDDADDFTKLGKEMASNKTENDDYRAGWIQRRNRARGPSANFTGAQGSTQMTG